MMQQNYKKIQASNLNTNNNRLPPITNHPQPIEETKKNENKPSITNNPPPINQQPSNTVIQETKDERIKPTISVDIATVRSEEKKE